MLSRIKKPRPIITPEYQNHDTGARKQAKGINEK